MMITKGKKTIIAVAVIAAVCGVLAILLAFVILPKQKRNRARELIASGEYEKAYALLEELGDREAVAASKYDRAATMISAGEQEAAYALLNGLMYKDSAEKAAACLFRIQRDRLHEVKVGSSIRFGSYEQDNLSHDGMEEIQWNVLAMDGSKALIISENALDHKHFNEEYVACSWSGCSLREWLNETFYTAAFSPEHRKMIVNTLTTTDKNPDYGTSSGSNTMDSVFLLSVEEALRYFDSDGARQCYGTPYCYEAGATERDGRVYWWLRTSGQGQIDCTAVTPEGAPYTPGFCVNNDSPAVRPALWIDLDAN